MAGHKLAACCDNVLGREVGLYKHLTPLSFFFVSLFSFFLSQALFVVELQEIILFAVVGARSDL